METTKRRDGLPLALGLWVGGAFLAVLVLALIGSRYAPPPAPAFGSIGSVGRIERGSLWVDQAGLAAFDRAYANRDERGMQAAVATYEGLLITEPTPVRVTARQGDIVQVELLAGPYVGRRGWGRSILLVP